MWRLFIFPIIVTVLVLLFSMFDKGDFELDVTHSLIPGSNWIPSKVRVYFYEREGDQVQSLFPVDLNLVEKHTDGQPVDSDQETMSATSSPNMVDFRDIMPSPYPREATSKYQRNSTHILTSKTIGDKMGHHLGSKYRPFEPIIHNVWPKLANASQSLDARVNAARVYIYEEVRASLEHMRLKSMPFTASVHSKTSSTADYNDKSSSLCIGAWAKTRSARDYIDPTSVKEFFKTFGIETGSTELWKEYVLRLANETDLLKGSDSDFSMDIFASSCSMLFPISFPNPKNPFLKDLSDCLTIAKGFSDKDQLIVKLTAPKNYFGNVLKSSAPRFLSSEVFVPSLQTLRSPTLVPLSPVYTDWLEFMDIAVFGLQQKRLSNKNSDLFNFTNQLRDSFSGFNVPKHEWAEWIIKTNFTRLSGGYGANGKLPKWPWNEVQERYNEQLRLLRMRSQLKRRGFDLSYRPPQKPTKPTSEDRVHKGSMERLAHAASPFQIPLSNAAFFLNFTTRAELIKACSELAEASENVLIEASQFSKFIITESEAFGRPRTEARIAFDARQKSQTSTDGMNIRLVRLCRALPQLLSRTRPKLVVIPSPNPDEWVAQYVKCAAHWQRERYDDRLSSMFDQLPTIPMFETSRKNSLNSKELNTPEEVIPLLKDAPGAAVLDYLSECMNVAEKALLRMLRSMLEFFRSLIGDHRHSSNKSELDPLLHIEKLNLRRDIRSSVSTMHQIARAELQARNARIEVRLISSAKDDKYFQPQPWLGYTSKNASMKEAGDFYTMPLHPPRRVSSVLRIISRPSETMFRGHMNLTTADAQILLAPNTIVTFDSTAQQLTTSTPVGLSGLASVTKAIAAEHSLHRAGTESPLAQSPAGAGTISSAGHICMEGSLTGNMCQAVFGKDSSPKSIAKTLLAPLGWVGIDVEEFLTSLLPIDRGDSDTSQLVHITSYRARENTKAKENVLNHEIEADTSQFLSLHNHDSTIPSRLDVPRLNVDPFDWSSDVDEIHFSGPVLLETISQTTAASSGGSGDGDEWLAFVYDASSSGSNPSELVLKIVRLFPEGHPLRRTPLQADIALESLFPKVSQVRGLAISPVTLTIAATPTCFPTESDPCGDMYTHQVVMILGTRADLTGEETGDEEVYPGEPVGLESDPNSPPFILPFRLTFGLESDSKSDSSMISFKIDVKATIHHNAHHMNQELRQRALKLHLKEKYILDGKKYMEGTPREKERRAHTMWYMSSWLRGYEHAFDKPPSSINLTMSASSYHNEEQVSDTSVSPLKEESESSSLQQVILDSLFESPDSRSQLFSALLVSNMVPTLIDNSPLHTLKKMLLKSTEKQLDNSLKDQVGIQNSAIKRNEPRRLPRIAVPLSSLLPPPVYLNTYIRQSNPLKNESNIPNVLEGRKGWTHLGTDVSHGLPPLALAATSPAALIASPIGGGMRSDKLAVLSLDVTPASIRAKSEDDASSEKKVINETAAFSNPPQMFNSQIARIVKTAVSIALGITPEELQELVNFFSSPNSYDPSTSPLRRKKEKTQRKDSIGKARQRHEDTILAYTLDTWTIADINRGYVSPSFAPSALRLFGQPLRKEELPDWDEYTRVKRLLRGGLSTGEVNVFIDKLPIWSEFKRKAKMLSRNEDNYDALQLEAERAHLLGEVSAFLLSIQQSVHVNFTSQVQILNNSNHESESHESTTKLSHRTADARGNFRRQTERNFTKDWRSILMKPRMVLMDGLRFRPLLYKYQVGGIESDESALTRHTILTPLIEQYSSNITLNSSSPYQVFHTISTSPPRTISSDNHSAPLWTWTPYEQMTRTKDIVLSRNPELSIPHRLRNYLRERRLRRPPLVAASADGRITVITESPLLITIDAGAFYGVVSLIQEVEGADAEAGLPAMNSHKDPITSKFVNEGERELDFKSIAVNVRGNILALAISDNSFIVMGRRFISRFEDRTMAPPVRSSWQRLRMRVTRNAIKAVKSAKASLKNAMSALKESLSKDQETQQRLKAEINLWRTKLSEAKLVVDSIKEHHAPPRLLRKEFEETKRHFTIPSSASEASRQSRTMDPLLNPFGELHTLRHSFQQKLAENELKLEKYLLNRDRVPFRRRPDWSWFWEISSKSHGNPSANESENFFKPWEALDAESLIETRLPRDPHLNTTRSSTWHAIGEITPPPALSHLKVVSISLIDSSLLPPSIAIYRCEQDGTGESKLKVRVSKQNAYGSKYKCSTPQFEPRSIPLRPLSTYLVALYENGVLAAFDVPFGDRAAFAKVVDIVESELPPYVSSRSRVYSEEASISHSHKVIGKDLSLIPLWLQRHPLAEASEAVPASLILQNTIANVATSAFPMIPTPSKKDVQNVQDSPFHDFPIARQPPLPPTHPSLPVYPFLAPPAFPMLTLVAQALPSRYAILPESVVRTSAESNLAFAQTSSELIESQYDVDNYSPISQLQGGINGIKAKENQNTVELKESRLDSSEAYEPQANLALNMSKDKLGPTREPIISSDVSIQRLEYFSIAIRFVENYIASSSPISFVIRPFAKLLKGLILSIERTVDDLRIALLEAAGELDPDVQGDFYIVQVLDEESKELKAASESTVEVLPKSQQDEDENDDDLDIHASKQNDTQSQLSKTSDKRAGSTRSSKATVASWTLTVMNGLFILIVLPFALGLLIARHYGGPRPQAGDVRPPTPPANQIRERTRGAIDSIQAEVRADVLLADESKAQDNPEVARAIAVSRNAAVLLNSIPERDEVEAKEEDGDNSEQINHNIEDGELRRRQHGHNLELDDSRNLLRNISLLRPSIDLYDRPEASNNSNSTT